MFKWMEENLKSSKAQTSGEDFADSIALIVIMCLVYFMIFG